MNDKNEILSQIYKIDSILEQLREINIPDNVPGVFTKHIIKHFYCTVCELESIKEDLYTVSCIIK